MAGLQTKTKQIVLPSFTTASVQTVYVDAKPFFPLVGRFELTRGSTAHFANGLVAWILRANGDGTTQVAWDAYQLQPFVLRRPQWWPLFAGQEAVRALLALPGPYSLHIAFDPQGDANTGSYAWLADASVMR